MNCAEIRTGSRRDSVYPRQTSGFGMGKPLSTDQHFGVGVASVICWDAARRATGAFAPKAQDGHIRSRRLEVRGDAVMTAFNERRNQTLVELSGRLAAHGIATSKSALSRFFQRCGITLKTYGPPRWQVGCFRPASVVRKRIRRSGAEAVAMMEIRASWSS